MLDYTRGDHDSSVCSADLRAMVKIVIEGLRKSFRSFYSVGREVSVSAGCFANKPIELGVKESKFLPL
jgi:hypothetical protein